MPATEATRATARRRTTTSAVVALIAVASLALAACAGSSDATSTSSGASKTTTTTPKAVTRAATAGKVADGPATPSPGCGTSTVRSVTLQKQFLDDSQRWWLLTTPLEHDGKTPLPLVIDFHGLSEGAEVHSKMSELSPFSQDHGFVLVTPNGTGTPTKWAITPDATGNADLVFTTDMLDQLESSLCVDTSRVYATGLSNGAFISSAVACTLSDRIAAVAPVSGLLHPKPCDTTRPVPVLTFHGTDDPILLFNGGVGDRLGQIMAEGAGVNPTDSALPAADLEGPGYPQAVKEWAAQNGCKDTFTDTALTDTVTTRTYDCPADGAVEFQIIKGGGHSWPHSEFSKAVAKMVGPTDFSINANELIWAFFQRFQLPA